MYAQRTLRSVGLVALLLVGAATAHGQSPLYLLSLPDVTGNPGAVVRATATLDNTAGSPVTGASAGICSDDSVALPLQVVPGQTLALLSGGVGPAFFAPGIFPGGCSFGTVFDFLGLVTLPPAPDHELADIDYELVGVIGESTPIAYCNTLGNPPIAVVVIVSGAQISPTTDGGSLEIVLGGPGGFGIDAPLPGPPGRSVPATVTLSNSEAVSGFRFGISYDPALLSLAAMTPAAALAATNGGAGPDLFSVSLNPAGGTGATVECTVSTSAPFESLAPGFAHELIDLEFDVDPAAGPPCSVTPIAFTGSLGAPLVPIEVTVASGATPAGATDGEIVIGSSAIGPPSGGIALVAENAYAVAGSPVSASIGLDTDTAIQGFSFGIGYDPTDVTLTSVAMGTRIEELRCGAGPDFFAAQIHTGASPGATVGCVFELAPPIVEPLLGPGSAEELARLVFQTSPNPTLGGSPLTFTGSLGSPAIAVEVTIDGQAVVPTQVSGAISFGDEFVRGDCNIDSGTDIADPIHLLGFLFPGTASPTTVYCEDACDANDDGGLDIADAIALLSALFGGGAATLPPPTGACDGDPSNAGDTLVCESFGSCP